MHDLYNGTKIPDLGAIWRRHLEFVETNEMRSDMPPTSTETLTQVFMTINWQDMKYIFDVADTYTHAQFLRRLVDCVWRQRHEVDLAKTIDMNDIPDEDYRTRIANATAHMRRHTDLNPVVESELDDFTLESRVQSREATPNEINAFQCREVAHGFNISHENNPLYAETMEYIKIKYKFRLWSESAASWFTRMNALINHLDGQPWPHNTSLEQIDCNQRLWLIAMYVLSLIHI